MNINIKKIDGQYLVDIILTENGEHSTKIMKDHIEIKRLILKAFDDEFISR